MWEEVYAGGGGDGTGCCGRCSGKHRDHTCKASPLYASACGLLSDARMQMQMGTAGNDEAFLLYNI